MNCPVCSGRTTGKVGMEQYYCWDCCIEFSMQADKVVVYDLEEDGSLTAWDDSDTSTEDEALQIAAE
ncbi:MAG: hypothetical protein LBT22_01485 [Peptococcaceae bacterium]|nr:hypothetical protein [Peptococcaceae bacterium]